MTNLTPAASDRKVLLMRLITPQGLPTPPHIAPTDIARSPMPSPSPSLINPITTTTSNASISSTPIETASSSLSSLLAPFPVSSSTPQVLGREPSPVPQSISIHRPTPAAPKLGSTIR